MKVGEVIAAPSADKLNGFAACLLHADPEAQTERLRARGDDLTYILDRDDPNSTLPDDARVWVFAADPPLQDAGAHEVKLGGQQHYMDFARGVTTTKLTSVGTVKAKDTGTKVWFKPDPTIFTVLEYDFKTLELRLRELSYLNKGVTIILRDERPEEPHEVTFHAKGGLREMVQFLNANRKPLHAEVVYIETERDGDHAYVSVHVEDEPHTVAASGHVSVVEEYAVFDRIITELKDRVDETGAPATTWGIHPEFGEVVAVRTAEGAVLVGKYLGIILAALLAFGVGGLIVLLAWRPMGLFGRRA